MRILITGATGLIGRRLVVDRLERGDTVVVVSRDRERARAIFAADANPNVEVVEGNPGTPGPWQRAIDGCGAVVHLAGAGVADRRWTPSYQKEIWNSRIDGTHQLVEGLRAARSRPDVLVCASAVGWYGETGDRGTDESAPADPDDFLARLCAAWEQEALGAGALGVRVVTMRTGVVLDDRGGLLPRLVVPFRAWIGGPIGLGRQYVPWIHWRDLVGLYALAIAREDARGAMNATAPMPVTNRELSSAIGRAIGRPSWLPVPPLALRMVLGPVARYAMMSQRIVPARALRLGHRFVHPEIGAALVDLLRHNRGSGGSR